MESSQTSVTISLLDIWKVFVKRWILIVLVAVLAGVGTFSFFHLTMEPTYTSTTYLYVNNNSLSIGASSISLSTGDISASRNLVEVYNIILKTRTVLQTVSENTKDSCSKQYTYEELEKMISGASVKNTEIMQITVKSENKTDSKILANEAASVLQEQINSIIDGSSAKIVDLAVEAMKPDEQGKFKKALIGFLIGFVLSYGTCFVLDVLVNDTLDGVDWIKETFHDAIPVLSVIPDSTEHNSKHYGKYGYYRHYYQKDDDDGKGV